MKRAAVCLAGALVLSAVFTTAAFAAKRSNVTISNDSKWTIHHFFLSPSTDDEWGPDQLGHKVIKRGQSFTLKGIPCDEYDVKLVDEDGDECVVEAVDVCGGDDEWVITDEDLLDCEGY
jgi:hypothetical protein